MLENPPVSVVGSVWHSAAASRQGWQHEQAAAPTVHQAAKEVASIQAAKEKNGLYGVSKGRCVGGCSIPG